MCEGIARAGHGECLMALSSEEIVNKCAHLFRAGRTFLLKNVTVDWGVPNDTNGADTSQALRQAPAQIGSISPGFRSVIFALFKNANFVVPKKVTLIAQRDGVGEALKFPVPVEEVKFSDKNSLRLIHTLTARRLITDLEDNALALGMTEEHMKAAIVDLGETYQLASRHTSFIAVEDSDDAPLPMPRPTWSKAHDRKKATAENTTSGPGAATSGGILSSIAGYTYTAITTAGIIVSEFLGNWLTASRRAPQIASRSGARAPAPDDGDDDEYASDNTFSTLSSFFSSESDVTDTNSRSSTPDSIARSPSPDFKIDPIPIPPPTDPLYVAGPLAPVDPGVQLLMRMQSHDGSFVVNDAFRNLLGHEAVDRKRPVQVSEELWATALALAYYRKHMASQREMLDCLEEKAFEYAEGLRRSGNWTGNFAALVSEATAAL